MSGTSERPRCRTSHALTGHTPCHAEQMDEVFVFEVEDIDADAWLAEVAVVAESRQAAFWKIRDAGLHKKQIHGDGRPVRTHHVLEFANAFDDRATARTTPRAGIVGNGGSPFRCAGPGPRSEPGALGGHAAGLPVAQPASRDVRTGGRVGASRRYLSSAVLGLIAMHSGRLRGRAWAFLAGLMSVPLASGRGV